MLETELKRLNKNIEHLNELLEVMANSAKAHTSTPEVEKLVEEEASTPEVEKLVEEETSTPEVEKLVEEETSTPEVENHQPEYSVDDIKSMALAVSRKDRSKQKDIKAKLAEHGAKIAVDLSGEALQAVGVWLSALKDELGA